ncbi:hypothetical protein ACTVZO_43810 [Streptomyces sp. IBSNAI002]|uniref:hypothetical protein n=1 Tax=Streptomyces sp. IBSNAI002 TaxID=3457500 RepID=UPI003FD4EF62
MPRTPGIDDTAPGPSRSLPRVLHTGPFHLALSHALAAKGLPLDRVRQRVASYGVSVGVTSLSYWQRGIRRPCRPESLRAVAALERVLDLPAGALTRLLPPSASSPVAAGRPPSRAYRSLVPVPGSVEELLADLEVPLDGGLHTLVHHERVRIGRRGQLQGHDSQHAVRAHRDGVDRYVAIHHGDRGCDAARMEVRAYENCRIGRVRRRPETGVVVAELLFDAQLRVGDTHVFAYGFEDGTADRCEEYVRGFSYTGGQYVLQIRFDEVALPLRCRRFRRVLPGGERTELRNLTANGRHRSVHLIEPGVRRGILGICWDWT